MEALLSGLAILSAVRDETGRIVDFRFEYINQAGAELNRRPREDHLGRTLLELLPEHASTGLFDMYVKVVETGEPFEQEALEYEDVYGRDGRRLQRVFDSRVAKLEDGVVSTWRDAGERVRAQEAFRLEHERFRWLVDSNIVGVAIADAAGNVEEANDYYLNLIGHTRKELEEGRVDWRALTPPEWLGADEGALRELGERGTCTPYEKEFLLRDGRRVPVYLADTMLPGSDRQIAAFVLDMTDRKRAEEDLRESERRFRSLFENMREGYAYCRIELEDDRPVDFVYLEVNRAFEDLTGLHGVVGKRVSEVIPGIRESNPEVLETYGRVVRTGEPAHLEVRLDVLEGMWLSIAVYGAEPGCFVAVFTNVTERKRAESALRESESRFRQIAEALPQLVWTSLPDGTCDYLSPQWMAYTGMPEERQLGFGWAGQVHPEDWPRIEASWGESVRTGAPPDMDLRIRRADGVYRWFKTRAVPMRGADGEIVKWFGTHTDVTDQVEAQQRLSESFAALERLSDEREWLLARLVKAQEEERQRVANDIHDDSIQIMTAVGLRLAALRGQAGDQAAEETLRTAEETVSLAIRRLRRLLFDLHPLSLDHSGLSAALEDLVRLLGEDAGPEYALDVELDEEPPPESRTILYRLAAEALGNARKYSGAGLVHVRVRAHSGGVRMTISDDGVGFDPAVSWAPGHLGLATMHERAQLAGGYCRVDSSRGSGTTVTCWIPTLPTATVRDVPSPAPGAPATRA